MVKFTLLTIMIPTHNRGKIAAENVNGLIQIIKANQYESLIDFIISDNASPDDTKLRFENIIEANPEISMALTVQSENIGISRNFKFVLFQATGKFVMYLGDDDYISENYLIRVIDTLSHDQEVTCIIPSYQNIDINGRSIDRGRDLGKTTQRYEKGFSSTFHNSWKCHQLSGLVFRAQLAQSAQIAHDILNMYPFIFDCIACTRQGRSYLIPEFPVLVTRPPQNKKAWGYGNDGLLNEVFQNYSKCSYYNNIQKSLLQLKFLDAQYWRFAMYLKKGPVAFLRCLWKIEIASNSMFLTRILFPFFLPVIGIKKTLSFLVTGQLFKVLHTKVDV